MDKIIIYFFEITASLVVFYIVYRLLFYKLTFFKFIRAYLLASILFAALAPLIHITYTIDTEKEEWTKQLASPVKNYKNKIHTGITEFSNSFISEGKFNDIQKQNTAPDTKSIKAYSNTNNITSGSSLFFYFLKISLLVIYFSGVAYFFFRFFYNIYIIYKNILKNKWDIIDGTRVIWMDKPVSAFSFLNTIFVSEQTNKEEGLQNIILHEKVHIKQLHSADLIFIELLIIVQWFNPVLWLYKKAIRRNHEFLADSGVIKKGVDIPEYKYTLLSHLLVNNKIQIASNYSFNDLRARLSMLSAKKSGHLAFMKFFVAIPFAAVLFFLLSVSFIISENTLNKQTLSSWLSEQIKIAKPEPIRSIDIENVNKNAITKKLIIRERKNLSESEIKVNNKNCEISNISGVDFNLLTTDNGLFYIQNDSNPYTGYCYSFFETGELGLTGFFINGKANGEWTFWYPNGQKRAEYTVVDGLKDGYYHSWYKDGKVRIEAMYNLGEVDDLYQSWHENGVLKKESCFYNGVPFESKVFDENGNPSVLL